MNCFSYIRFSSPEQAKGRSRERQLETARKFAKEQGWELDESLCMYDPAMSGFHSEHISKGELGVFLEAVKARKIQTPCALLVENLDRLSREKIPAALRQFLDIIDAGISIVTLMDRQIYDSESISDGMQQLLISISIMSRSYEESRTKQIRRADNWSKGRKEAYNGKKIPARCAAWLKLSGNKTEFIPIPAKVDVVKRVYDLYIEGHGLAGICRIFNREDVPAFQNKKSIWGTTTVRRILTTRTVLGEMQFMKTTDIVNGKRIMKPDGEPITDYYPQIIDNETFYKAKKRQELRKCAFGKIGAMNNLFSGIIKCGYCSSTMEYNTRGHSRHKYLNCRKTTLGTCDYMSFRYQDFEDAFLLHCTKLKLPDIIKDDISEHERKIVKLKDELLTVNSMVKQSVQKVENYTTAISAKMGGSIDTIKHFTGLINIEKEEQRNLSERKRELSREINQLENMHQQTATSLSSLYDAIEQLSSVTGDERESIRRRLQKEIRTLVKKIDVYPHGRSYKRFKELLETETDMPDDIRSHLENVTGKDAKKYRSCVVRFRGGGSLAFGHDHKTNGLQFMVEVDEDGQFTQRTYDKIEELLSLSTSIPKRDRR